MSPSRLKIPTKKPHQNHALKRESRPCSLFARGRCSGCTLLSIPYAKQVTEKFDYVRQTLAGVAARDQVRPVASSPLEMGWRTSVKLCLHEDRNGRKAIGLYRSGTRDVISIHHCPAEDPQADHIKGRLFAPKTRSPAPFYDHQGRVFQRGRLKYLIIRCAGPSIEDPAGVIVSHTGVDPQEIKTWFERAGLRHLSVYETRLFPQDRHELMGLHVRHVTGPAFFPYSLAGQDFLLPPMSFFQANRSLAASLIDAVGKTVRGPSPEALKAGRGAKTVDVLLDLYGGFGAYSFPLLDYAAEILLVDGNTFSIDAAQRRCNQIGATHLHPFAMTCENFLTNHLSSARKTRVSHMIVNPPRQGLSKQVLSLLQKENFPALKSLTYVSCNPTSLARDLTLLKAHGFAAHSIAPFDMFPGTQHIETVAHLTI